MKKLKKAMQNQGISQYKLSKLTGIPESTISRNFNGKNKMSLDNYKLICKVLKLS